MRPTEPKSWFTRLEELEEDDLNRIRAEYQALSKAARSGKEK